MNDTVIGYTDAEIEALHVPPQVLAIFLLMVMMSKHDTTKMKRLYPSEGPTYRPEEDVSCPG